MDRIETRVVRRVEVQDHHHVAVDSVDALGAQPVGRVLHLEGAAVRRADHEDVLRTGVRALRRGRRQVLQVDAVDLVVEVPAVAGGGAGDQHDHEQQGAAHPGRCALGRALLLGGSVRRSPGAASSPSLSFWRLRPGLSRSTRSASSICRPSSCRPFSTGFSATSSGEDGGSRINWARPLDLLSELMQALVDWVVLGVGRAHDGAVFWLTCEPWFWSTPVPRDGSGFGGRNDDKA